VGGPVGSSSSVGRPLCRRRAPRPGSLPTDPPHAPSRAALSFLGMARRQIQSPLPLAALCMLVC
ncbi:unnamed protein product, partial [Amoebophrya sp. A120]